VDSVIEPGADLRPLIEESLTRDTNRGDEQYAHISDTYACELSVWARRSGKPQLPKPVTQLWKFSLGHDVEKRVATALMVESLPMRFYRNERIAWNPYTMEVRRQMFEPRHWWDLDTREPCKGCGDCLPTDQEVIGNMDLCNENSSIVGEIKSIWFGMAVPEAAAPHYVDQVMGYATAIGATHAFVQVVAITIHGPRTEIVLAPTFWLNVEPHREKAIARAKAVIENTHRNAFPPSPKAQWDWQHKVCGYADCEFNTNPLKGKQ
jgi:hypothetical protein